jgi:hypothetical protein
MAIGAHFVHGNFPPASYEKAIAQLAEAGFGTPAGRLHHFALSSDSGNMEVFDIWESSEALDAFGPALMPILGGLGVDLVPPTVTPVYNSIQG